MKHEMKLGVVAYDRDTYTQRLRQDTCHEAQAMLSHRGSSRIAWGLL